jgi:integrase/recombinase XerD
MSKITTKRLTTPVAEWPPQDRALWDDAKRSGSPFRQPKPASTWTASRARKIEDAYGQLLTWLSQKGLIDPASAKGPRLTEDLADQYVSHLNARVAPVTVAINICYLSKIMSILEPKTDWTWLRCFCQQLKTSAPTVRDKRRAVVPAKALSDLGVSLMSAAEISDTASGKPAIQFRDGLMIVFAISIPGMRLSNLTSIKIGSQLVCNGSEYWLLFSKNEMKNRRIMEVRVPKWIVPWLERYLERHRYRLLRTRDSSVPMTDGLWVSRSGTMLTAGGIREQIEARTEKAFGHAIWPHLFRDCAVTSVAIEDSENAYRIPELMGHTKPETASRHYLQASLITAVSKFQEVTQKAWKEANLAAARL